MGRTLSLNSNFSTLGNWGQTTVSRVGFDVAPRIAGERWWETGQLIRLAVTAVTAYSAKPLALIFRLGVFGMVAALLLLIQALYSWVTERAVSGWTSLTVVVLFFGSANLLGIGVLGAYLAQLFDEMGPTASAEEARLMSRQLIEKVKELKKP